MTQKENVKVLFILVWFLAWLCLALVKEPVGGLWKDSIRNSNQRVSHEIREIVKTCLDWRFFCIYRFTHLLLQRDHVIWKPPITPRLITRYIRTSGSKVIRQRVSLAPTIPSIRGIRRLKWMEQKPADILAKHNTLIQVITCNSTVQERKKKKMKRCESLKNCQNICLKLLLRF